MPRETNSLTGQGYIPDSISMRFISIQATSYKKPKIVIPVTILKFVVKIIEHLFCTYFDEFGKKISHKWGNDLNIENDNSLWKNGKVKLQIYSLVLMN